MAFVPRNFEQILNDMVAHVRANTTLTDFTVGSVIRTLLEAAALEDDEQYFQMVKLLDAFRILTASGVDLDERAADYNLTRLSTGAAAGYIYILNEALVRSDLTFDVLSGAASLTIDDGSSFPLTPPFFTVRIGEGTPQVEDVNVSSHSGNNLVLVTPLTQNHGAGEQVAVIPSSPSFKTIPRGLQVQVPPTTTNLPIKFTTVENGILIDGNYRSGLIKIAAVEAGRSGNAPVGMISQFVSSPPFAGAAVTNPSDTNGGRDRESDNDFRDRLMRKFDELSRGTPKAVENSATGVSDVLTGRTITSAHLRENRSSFEHVLYVDDGTGLIPDVVNMAASTLGANAMGGSTSSIQVVDVSQFPGSGTVLLTSSDPSLVEVVSYNAKTVGTQSYLVLSGSVAHNHVIGDEVLLVEEVSGAAEDGQNFFHLAHWPIRANTTRIYDDSSGLLSLRESDVFALNRASGDLEYLSLGMPEGSKVYAHYSYVTGILQQVQRVLNGDPADTETYPGVVALGITVHVETPTLRPVEVVVALSVLNGYDAGGVATEVQRSLQSYVDSRRIGDNIMVSKIIELAMAVAGVDNVIVKAPTRDIVVLEDELPVSHDSNGNSLVTVL